MPEYATISLPPLTLSVQWPLEWTPPLRNVQTLSNALSAEPVQGVDYIAEYGLVRMRVRLKGIDTQGETAADHVQRQFDNLCAVVANDSNTFSVTMGGASTGKTVRVFKSDPPVRVDDFVADRRHIRFVDLTLRYLDL
jgi:hypothetical protein